MELLELKPSADFLAFALSLGLVLFLVFIAFLYQAKFYEAVLESDLDAGCSELLGVNAEFTKLEGLNLTCTPKPLFMFRLCRPVL